ncbi:phosphate starvation protein PhoH, partial [Escherichia coli]
MRSRFSAFYPTATYGLQASQPPDFRSTHRPATGPA